MSEPTSQAPLPPALASDPSSTRLALPAPPSSDEPLKLDVSTGESVSLYDRLGPTVVNTDGTLSRIMGWSEMGENERARILRVLGKRNALRLDAKKEELAKEAADGKEKVVEGGQQ
ncbi:hypothetical protein JCM5353_004573 [Sporobolomyces roseus]